VRYTADRLWQEAVYLAYYLHWSLAEILDLPHHVRTLVIDQVGAINLRTDRSVPMRREVN
jgi:hypothetical protein